MARLNMTSYQKVRLGMLALGGIGILFAAVGIRTPLEHINGFGTT